LTIEREKENDQSKTPPKNATIQKENEYDPPNPMSGNASHQHSKSQTPKIKIQTP
jgi:hypothetical protein